MARSKPDRHAPRFPLAAVAAISALCLLPLPWLWAGSTAALPSMSLGELADQIERNPTQVSRLATQIVRPRTAHALLEWTAGMVAIVTATLAVAHFLIRRDVATPVIGTALFFAGVIDLCHALAVTSLLTYQAPETQFVPFTWFLSRVFHASILVFGILPFAGGRSARRMRPERSASSVALAAVVFGGGAYSVIAICAMVPRLPLDIHPTWTVVRPFAAIPLILYLVAAGIVLPRFSRRRPSRFADAIALSILPHVAAQIYVGFAGGQVFGPAQYAASALKGLGYLIPLLGLLGDYAKAHKAEAKLVVTSQKLEIAKTVHSELLPENIPHLSGYDLAGYSTAAGAIGGDFYDFVPLADGRLAIVVGDVSGHEIGAAIVMAQTRAYLRALGPTSDDPADLLAALARFVTEEVRASRFVCLLVAVIAPDSDEAEVFCLGHEAALCRVARPDAGTDEEPEAYTVLRSLGPPVGMVAKDSCEPPHRVTLRDGDALVFVTDGILETASPHGEQFGLDRVVSVVVGNPGEEASEWVAELRRSVELFSNHSPQVDDCTVVVIRKTGPTGPPPEM